MMDIDFYGAITLDQVRLIGQRLRGQVAERIDPQQARAEQRRLAVTVAEAVESYLDDVRDRAESGAKRGKRSSYGSARSRLERHVLPKLGNLRICDVTAEHVRRLHRALKETPIEANRMLTCFFLSAVFGHADRAELVPAGFGRLQPGSARRARTRRAPTTRK